MKIIDILNYLNEKSGAHIPETVDTVLASTEEERTEKLSREVKKVAVCFTAEPSVLRRAAQFGADLILTHEPTYYNHRDILADEALILEKDALVKAVGAPILRYHDHMHRAVPDWIHQGFAEELGLPFDWTEEGYLRFREPVSAGALAERMKERFGLPFVRFIGNPDAVGDCMMLALGETGPDSPLAAFKKEDIQFTVCGEANEWKLGEYVRDAGKFGHSIGVFTLGHSMSEKPGMRWLCKMLAEAFPEAEWRYIESEEMYTLL